MIVTIRQSNRSIDIPACLRSYQAIGAKWVYFLPLGCDDFDILALAEIQGVLSRIESLKVKPLSISLDGLKSTPSGLQWVDSVSGGCAVVDINVGPMLIDARSFASMAGHASAVERPWTISEELAIACMTRKPYFSDWSRCILPFNPIRSSRIDRGSYDLDGWNEMYRKCAGLRL